MSWSSGGRVLRSRWAWVAVAAILVSVLGGLLVASWWSTYRQARAVADGAVELKSLVAARDWDQVMLMLPELTDQADALAAATDSPSWWLLSSLPVVGASAAATRPLAVSAADIATHAAPVVRVGRALAGGSLLDAEGAFDVGTLRSASGDIAALATAVKRSKARLDAIDEQALLEPMREPLGSIRSSIGAGVAPLQQLEAASRWVPGMLGADGERRWLVLLQNPAEARGSGGFIGGYAIIRAVGGRLTLERSGTSGELAQHRIPIKGAPQDARLLWGDLLDAWNEANLSPHFPVTAELAVAGMRAMGERVDGVIAVDPAFVATLLEVTGPVTYRGTTITGATTERYFTVDQYRLHPNDTERDEIAVGLIRRAFNTALRADLDLATMVKGGSQPYAAGGLRVWSAEPSEQRWLETTVAGGVLSDQPGPTVAVAFNNASGNKLDAFVRSSLEYSAGQCQGLTEQKSAVTVTLANQAPDGLTDGYYGRNDQRGGPAGSTSMLVHVYGPVSAEFVGAMLDGEPTDMYLGTERGRPVWWTYVDLPRGRERVLTVDFVEPTFTGVPTVLTGSMAIPTEITIEPIRGCRT